MNTNQGKLWGGRFAGGPSPELEAGGADRITRNPAAEGDESDRVLDDVAMEIGTD